MTENEKEDFANKVRFLERQKDYSRNNDPEWIKAEALKSIAISFDRLVMVIEKLSQERR